MLGPGLLESIYEERLVEELKSGGFKVESQKKIPLSYKGRKLCKDFRIDLLVEDTIVIELKAVEELQPIYKAQLLTYLKLLKKPKGLLINFHCENRSSQLVSLVIEVFLVVVLLGVNIWKNNILNFTKSLI